MKPWEPTQALLVLLATPTGITLWGARRGRKRGLSYSDAHVFHFLTQLMPVAVSWVLPSHCSHRICLGDASCGWTMQGEKQINISPWSILNWSILLWKLLLSNGRLCSTFRVTAKNDSSNDFCNRHQIPNPVFASFTVEVSWQQSQCWCFMQGFLGFILFCLAV